MQFVLFLYGRLSVKTNHLYEVYNAIDFLELDKSVIAESLIKNHEYHYATFEKQVVDIFVVSG